MCVCVCVCKRAHVIWLSMSELVHEHGCSGSACVCADKLLCVRTCVCEKMNDKKSEENEGRNWEPCGMN